MCNLLGLSHRVPPSLTDWLAVCNLLRLSHSEPPSLTDWLAVCNLLGLSHRVQSSLTDQHAVYHILGLTPSVTFSLCLWGIFNTSLNAIISEWQTYNTHIVIHRQSVSLYHNSPVWLDSQDASSWDWNPLQFYVRPSIIPLSLILSYTSKVGYIYIYIYTFFKEKKQRPVILG